MFFKILKVKSNYNYILKDKTYIVLHYLTTKTKTAASGTAAITLYLWAGVVKEKTAEEYQPVVSIKLK